MIHGLGVGWLGGCTFYNANPSIGGSCGHFPLFMHPLHEPSHLPVEVPDPAAQDEITVVPLKIEDWLTVIVMGLLALITFANVLVRYFSDQSFAWTEEFSVFLMIVLALVAGSASVARNRQIRIEFFADSGSPARQRGLARFGAIMVFLLFAMIAVLSSRVVWDDFRYGETSPGIGVPQWWYTIWLPIMSVAIAGRALGLYIRRGRRA
jgi:TRAP-type C4-dicarboxylate transport system permease small subunit